MVALSERVVDTVHRTFHAAHWVEVSELLQREHADNLPFMSKCYKPAQFDRGRLALLKLSAGDPEKLRQALDLGKADWRDLFMAAGFGDVEAHVDWYKTLTARSA